MLPAVTFLPARWALWRRPKAMARPSWTSSSGSSGPTIGTDLEMAARSRGTTSRSRRVAVSEFMGWICRGVETQKTPARGEHWGLLIEADALSGRISRQASKLVRWAGRESGYSGVTSVGREERGDWSEGL